MLIKISNMLNNSLILCFFNETGSDVINYENYKSITRGKKFLEVPCSKKLSAKKIPATKISGTQILTGKISAAKLQVTTLNSSLSSQGN